MSKEQHVMPLDLKESPDILLVNVPSTFQQGIIPDRRDPPFGLLRLASVSEKYGYKSALLDIDRARIDLSEFDDILYGIKPKLIGINPTSVNITEAQEIAELCAIRDIPFIVGGVHATLDPITALKRDFSEAKAVVKGKGEIPILHILNDFKFKRETKEKGILYQETNNNKPMFADYYSLDQIPLIDQNRWVENPILEKVIEIDGKIVKLREISLYETTGCPFKCTYCATPALTGKTDGYKSYYRPSIQKILKDVDSAVKSGANAIHFLDDMAFTQPNHFYEFNEGIEKMNLSEKLYWRGMTRASIINNCSDKDLDILKKSGCWRITLGVESGSDVILKRIKKGITTEQVRESILKLKKAGIPQIKAFFIMGFPEETMDQMRATHDFIMELKHLGLTNINIFQFKPYPGTEEWQFLEKTNPNVLRELSYIKNRIKSEDSIVDTKISQDAWLRDDIKISTIKSKDVRELVIETMEEFYKK